MFTKSKLSPANAHELTQFLNRMRGDHWSLSSQGYRTRPTAIEPVTARELIRGERRPDRLGTFLLKEQNTIIACVQVDEKEEDGRVAVMSGAETAPEYQRRGTFWRQLAIPVIRVLCSGSFDRIDALTWTLNRKGIPVYKRFGFRAVPGSSLTMENHLPMIVRHPTVGAYLAGTDLLRGLRTTRSYGYDDVDCGSLSAFVYEWSGRAGSLRVLVDWRRRRIAAIETERWQVSCFTASLSPFRARYTIRNKQSRSLGATVMIPSRDDSYRRVEAIPAGGWCQGEICFDERQDDLRTDATVDVEIESMRIPFRLRRFAAAMPTEGVREVAGSLQYRQRLSA